MKKILLSLLLLVSFSYASPTNFYYPNTAGGLPVFLVYEGKNYKLSNGVIETEPHTSCSSISDSAPDVVMSLMGSSVYYRKGTYRYSDQWISNARCILAYAYYSPIASCPEGQVLDENDGCTEEEPLSECDPLKGTYTNLDGQCTDCTPYLQGTSLQDMASCACSAGNSTYVPQLVSPLPKTVYKDNFAYTQSYIVCSDGTNGNVWYNKRPMEADNNGTTPSDDNNSTTPPDNNSSTGGTTGGTGENNNSNTTTETNTTKPNDSNGTGTKPSDGNGTNPNNGSGKDYTGDLKKIEDTLNSIDKGIHGDFPLDGGSNYGFPSDAKGSDWNTYSETWDNIVGSISDVSSKANEFKNLVENGLESPFSKSSLKTCPYSTSFEFGAVGTIPISFDLCNLFSPLYSVIYVFSYAFFVVSILIFHVKMFMRLV